MAKFLLVERETLNDFVWSERTGNRLWMARLKAWAKNSWVPIMVGRNFCGGDATQLLQVTELCNVAGLSYAYAYNDRSLWKVDSHGLVSAMGTKALPYTFEDAVAKVIAERPLPPTNRFLVVSKYPHHVEKFAALEIDAEFVNSRDFLSTDPGKA